MSQRKLAAQPLGCGKPLPVSVMQPVQHCCEPCQRFWGSEGTSAQPVGVSCELAFDCSHAQFEVIEQSSSTHVNTAPVEHYTGVIHRRYSWRTRCDSLHRPLLPNFASICPPSLWQAGKRRKSSSGVHSRSSYILAGLLASRVSALVFHYVCPTGICLAVTDHLYN